MTPIRPPFTLESALAKVQAAEVRAFLSRKWQVELDYRLKKELWTFSPERPPATAEVSP